MVRRNVVQALVEELTVDERGRKVGLRRGNLGPTVRHTAHVAAFHAVRLPWYALLTARAAVVGGWRVADGQRRWWWWCVITLDHTRVGTLAFIRRGDPRDGGSLSLATAKIISRAQP
jgi:hypothetical protein